MRSRSSWRSLSLVLTILALAAAGSETPEVRAGVWAAPVVRNLPLPVSGYQVYMAGEMHGLQENEEFGIQYLTILYSQSGLRDVAIEEDSVYQAAAQAFVDGKAETLPRGLCLRAGILNGIRRINARDPNANIRVHLTDIDSPATAIRQHLMDLQGKIQAAASVKIPELAEIKENGLRAVQQLKRFPISPSVASELRTVEYSIGAYRQGLEVDIGPSKGSPFLEDREQAVAGNIEDLIRVTRIPSLLVLYGADHVSRSPRRDGGPNRDQRFSPVALRLQQAGLRVYSVVTFPLAGRYSWRGQESDMLWTASDGHLESGETLDRLLAAIPDAKYVYIDTKRQRATLPSDDISRYAVDAFLLFPRATPMTNRCPGQ